MFGKQKVAAVLAEFVGAIVLASVALAMLERTSFPFFLGVAMGVTYAVFWFVFGRNSGAQFNPVVTLGLWSLRKIRTGQAAVFMAAQLLGGLLAWRLNEHLQGGPVSATGGKSFDWRIMWAEAIGTFVFGLAVAAALYNDDDDLKKAITVGGGLFLGVSMAAFASNALLNPAVAIGVHSFSWSYVVGPLIGAVVGMNLYAWLFAPAEVVVVKSTVSTPATTKKVPAVASKKPVTRRTASVKKTTATRKTTARKR